MSTTSQTTTQTPESSLAAQPVSNQRTAARGAISKQMQSWIYMVIISVAAVGLWFSTSAKPKIGSSSAATASDQVKPLIGGLTPDEVQRRLQESEDIKRTLGSGPLPRQVVASDMEEDATLPSSQSPSDASARDPIADDERKRDYAGRFSSNVALSYRSDSRSGGLPIAGTATPASPTNEQDLSNSNTTAPAAPALPPDFQRQLQMFQAQQDKLLLHQQQLGAGSQSTPQPSPVPASSAHKNADRNAATGKEHVIFEGTVLDSVLVNRLNGDFAGPVICQITTDLYSHDHAQLLIPAGTRVLGEAKKVSDVGQSRLAVVFHRLIMPDGYAVDLDQAPGLDQIGETALHDQANHHYFMIFGSSIAVGAIAGLATIGTNNSAVTGLPASNASAYTEGVSASLSQSSLQILNRYLNIPPTITIREGHRVRIFMTQDLLVPAYADHKMPSDL